EIEIVSSEDIGTAVDEAALVATEQNTARDLQNLPSNELTPTALAEHALERASEIDSLECDVLGPAEITKLDMGGLLAVAKGSDEEPRFIVMRYRGGGAGTLAFVGKAVTF